MITYITCDFFSSSEAKEQVLANLANFAYDPKNVEYLRELQVTDLFLDMLTEENENFVEFGMGGCHSDISFIVCSNCQAFISDFVSRDLRRAL